MILIQKQKYKQGKKINGLLDVSGTKIAEALGIKIYTPKIRPKCILPYHIINYGCSTIPWLSNDDNVVVINKPESIHKACNKHLTFKLLAYQEIPCPIFTTNINEAAQWFDIPKTIVFCRTLLSASKGKGIVVARRPEELVDAPLYTLYIPKSEEYRFHVAFNKVIHIQKKKKLTAEELTARNITNIEPLVRNVTNGYVFSSNLELELDDDGSYKDPKYFMMTEHAIHSIQALGLDFGAVDLIVGKDGRTYVLEVNTAPGIEGITLERYISAFSVFSD